MSKPACGCAPAPAELTRLMGLMRLMRRLGGGTPQDPFCGSVTSEYDCCRSPATDLDTGEIASTMDLGIHPERQSFLLLSSGGAEGSRGGGAAMWWGDKEWWWAARGAW